MSISSNQEVPGSRPFYEHYSSFAIIVLFFLPSLPWALAALESALLHVNRYQVDCSSYVPLATDWNGSRLERVDTKEQKEF